MVENVDHKTLLYRSKADRNCQRKWKVHLLRKSLSSQANDFSKRLALICNSLLFQQCESYFDDIQIFNVCVQV